MELERLIDYNDRERRRRQRHADPDVLSGILTDWNWNNPGYYHSYRSVGALVNEHGKERLAQYPVAGPTPFFKDHLALQRESAAKSELSPRLATIVGGLAANLSACGTQPSS